MYTEKKSVKIEEVWSRALKHQQSSRVGTPSDARDYQICPCCDQVIEKQPIGLCEHTKQLQSYGFGYPLWFSFLKYCIILMLVLIASKTANELYMGAQENWEFCYGKQAMAENGSNQNQHSNQNLQNNSQIPKESPNNHSKENLNPIETNNQFFKNDGSVHVSVPTIQTHLHKKEEENEKKLGQTKEKTKCTSFMVFLSIFKGQKMYQNYFLKGVEFFIHIIALIGVRNMILKEQQYYDQRTTLISKYSLIIHNLPNVYGIKKKVQTLFQQQFGMSYGLNDSEIKDFIFVFKDEKMMKMSEEREQLEDQILKSQIDQDQQDEKSMRQRKQELEDMLNKSIQQTRKQIENDRIKCNKMIVVMRTQGDKASVLYSFKEAMKENKNFSQYFYDVDQLNDEVSYTPTKLLIKQAPEPNEIIWEHIDEPDNERKLLIVQGYIFTFLFLAVITVVFYFIMLAKTHLFLEALEMQENDPTNIKVNHFKAFATFIVFVALFGVVLFNKFVMGKVLHFFVHMEHHAYTDKQNHSFALKYALGMFFTTALMTIAVEAITYNNFYTHPYGVIEQQTIMFFVTAFIIPLIWWIHPYNVIKNLKRSKKFGKLMSQKQANELVEFYPYMLGKRYAQIFQVMWFTFLYSQLIPLGSFLMLVGLVLYYWVDKYNFLRCSAVKTRVSGKMAILGLKSLDATLFLTYAGQLLFRALIRNKFDYPALIFMFIGIIYMFLPVTSFIWQLNGQKFLIQQKSYEQSKKKFKQTYYNMHPIYKLTHKNEIEEHRKIVQQFYKHDLRKVKHYGTGRGNYRRQSTLISKTPGQVITSEQMRL